MSELFFSGCFQGICPCGIRLVDEVDLFVAIAKGTSSEGCYSIQDALLCVNDQ